MDNPEVITTESLGLSDFSKEYKKDYDWGWCAPTLMTWCRQDSIMAIHSGKSLHNGSENCDIVINSLSGSFFIKYIESGKTHRLGKYSIILIKANTEFIILSEGCLLTISRTDAE